MSCCRSPVSSLSLLCLGLVCLCSLGLHTACVLQRAQWPSLPHTLFCSPCLFIRSQGREVKWHGKKIPRPPWSRDKKKKVPFFFPADIWAALLLYFGGETFLRVQVHEKCGRPVELRGARLKRVRPEVFACYLWSERGCCQALCRHRKIDHRTLTHTHTQGSAGPPQNRLSSAKLLPDFYISKNPPPHAWVLLSLKATQRALTCC